MTDRYTDAALAATLSGDFRSEHAEVNGTRLHYVIGGTGSPLVLLPGWPQTWWQFRKIMPALAEHHRVIAVDLRGMGGSAKPAAGYDKKTMAKDIHELLRHLGIEQADVAGHDIGAMVAHSFAANHPETARRIALIDVPHPDDSLDEIPMLPPHPDRVHPWWFAFNHLHGLPEQLLAGRSRHLIDWLYQAMLLDQGKIDEQARTVYANAYDQPEAIRAGNGWYQTWRQDIADNRGYAKLTTPVLGVGGDQGYHYATARALPKQANDYELVEIADSGHYVAEEQPEALVAELRRFFAADKIG
ncbi:alpha/beta fold hydrolase [Crossiella cryophila]|uniref:Pimeloyl-ACP methyl ester carboxylesterase n=1 Tax=Crossiella cryophila TaxID=43355 RepID=A0A7W7FU63_9PSEU|nr:alpha/beta hydrolase [Crossiella cryophila]MBB4677750.1 pimeloyl-ACP methyl ester carboxylesterase [Crossiella cryophila]